MTANTEHKFITGYCQQQELTTSYPNIFTFSFLKQ